MTFDRTRFVADARELVTQGVQFRHQGSDPATGLDCINLPRYLIRLQGIALPAELDKEFESYHERPNGEHLLAIMREYFTEIPFEETEPGDLFILYARRNPQHLAIKVAEGDEKSNGQVYVVEAYRSEDKKVGELKDQPLDFRRRIAACFRIPDFA